MIKYQLTWWSRGDDVPLTPGRSGVRFPPGLHFCSCPFYWLIISDVCSSQWLVFSSFEILSDDEEGQPEKAWKSNLLLYLHMSFPQVFGAEDSSIFDSLDRSSVEAKTLYITKTSPTNASSTATKEVIVIDDLLIMEGMLINYESSLCSGILYGALAIDAPRTTWEALLDLECGYIVSLTEVTETEDRSGHTATLDGM